MCGFFFGQTPLIVLSPRKTVEGYLGGGLATMVLGLLMMMTTTMVMLMVMLVVMVNVMLMKVFIKMFFEVNIPFSSGPVLGLALQSQPSLLCPTSGLTPIPFPPDLPSLYLGSPSPFLVHCTAISLFASTLGPMAGFFCSGFKRACNR